MKAVSIVGMILVVVGIVLLAYFANPIRLMMGDFIPHKTRLLPPVLGGIALASGIAILFFSRPRDDQPR